MRASIIVALLSVTLIASAPITITRAPQSAAPAIAPLAGGAWMTAWIGTDARGVHHDARIINGDALSEPITLPLPPRRPFAQTLIPSTFGAHLLWIDAADADSLTLFTALLTPDLIVERGPVAVSNGWTPRYHAIADETGGALVAYVGGAASEPVLMLRFIDPAGRPRDEIAVMNDADHPALARAADGSLWLFWIAVGQVWRARVSVADNTPISGQVEALGGALAASPADRVENLSAGIDGASWGYLVWNITRGDGTRESFMARGRMDSAAWFAPERLAYADFPLRWSAPAIPPVGRGFDALALASGSDRGIVMTYWRDGEQIAAALALPDAQPLTAPALHVTDAGDVLLAWAENDGEAAALRLLRLR